MNKKQAAFNNYMRSKQLQSQYQQAILNQLQRTTTNINQNSFDIKASDLSHRSGLMTGGGQPNNNNNNVLNNSLYNLNQYLYGTQGAPNSQSTSNIKPGMTAQY